MEPPEQGQLSAIYLVVGEFDVQWMMVSSISWDMVHAEHLLRPTAAASIKYTPSFEFWWGMSKPWHPSVQVKMIV